MKKIVTAVSAITLTLQANDSISNEIQTNQQESAPEIFSIQGQQLDFTKTVALTSDLNVDGFASLGDTLTYTLRIENNNQFNASGVFVTDTLNSYVELDTESITTSQGTIVSGTTVGDNEVQVDLSNIAGQGFAEITFEVNVVNLPTNQFVEISNQAVASSSNYGTFSSDDPDTINGGDPTVIVGRGQAVPVPIFNNLIGFFALFGAIFLGGMYSQRKQKNSKEI